MRALKEHARTAGSFPAAIELLRSIGQAESLFHFYSRSALAALDRSPSFGDGRADGDNTMLVVSMLATDDENVLAIEANTLGAVQMVRAAYCRLPVNLLQT
jgi:hypothetical protein